MGTLGGEEAFVLGGLDLAGTGGGLAVGTTGLGEVSEDGLGLAMAGAGGDLTGDESELRVTGTGEDWALDLVRAGDEILACSSAFARRSERD